MNPFEERIEILSFRKRVWWESILYWLCPPYRHEQDRRLRQAIEALVRDPSMPCEIEGEIIPNGYMKSELERLANEDN